MEHFVACKEYGETLNVDWTEIYGHNMETQIVIGEFIEKRYIKRKEIIKQQEDGQTLDLGSTAPGTL